MAKRTTVLAHDDTDGSEAAEQVSFALDGVSFEIDLSERNAGQLREVLAPFVQAARRVGGRRRIGSKKAHITGATLEGVREYRQRHQDMRAWARRNGWNISDRGRLPAAVLEAYGKARDPESGSG